MTQTFTLGQQIACAQTEHERRKRDYPPLVARGRMRKPEADYEIACMEAIVRTLQDVRDRMTDDGR